MAQQTVDVSALINAGQTSGFIKKLVLITFLLVVADGFDISAVGVAIPGIYKSFGITDPNTGALMITASLFGILVGSPLFGLIGDRFGRKAAIISSCFLFGVFTWVTVFAGSAAHVIALRFVAGLGIGGLLPNVTALISELAPARYRAAVIILAFTGVAFGGGLPGLAGAALVPQYGWPVIFHIGGVFPIAVSILCIWVLPESVKFLVQKNKGGEAVYDALSKMGVAEGLNAGMNFVIADEPKTQGWAIGELFRGRLAVITPLLWLLFVANLMGYYFLLGWTPTVLLKAANIDQTTANLALLSLQMGGVAAGLLLFWFRLMERHGILPVVFFFALAVPVVAGIGYAASTQSIGLLFALQFLAGICCLGIQFSINAVSGMIYPTAVRSSGSGSALGVGRIGSIIGPLVGGALLARQLPIDQLYGYAALPFAAGCVITIILMRFYKKPALA